MANDGIDTDSSLLHDVKRYAVYKGLLLNNCTDALGRSNAICQFTARPTSFPKALFKRACAYQKYFNKLIHRLSLDDRFLRDALATVVPIDLFTGRLWAIYEKSDKGSAMMVISRSDYMVQTESLRQIELNTVAASLAGLSETMVDIHRFLQRRKQLDWDVPDNRALQGTINCLAEGVRYYNSLNNSGDSSATIVLFVVHQDENNIFDQVKIEFGLLDIHGIESERATFGDVLAHYELKEKRLFYKSREVSVVYYRTGYTPDHYTSEADWEAREILELSSAINCPSVAGQLVGCKKVQQVLANNGTLERVLDDSQAATSIRGTFAGLWNLDEVDGELWAAVISKPGDYVLKPMREGGGNNVYDEGLRSMFSKHERLPGYILMERIFPPCVNNHIIVDGNGAVKHSMVSELGIYGCLLYHGSKVLIETTPGWLLRSKSAHVTEGHVLKDNAVALDSPNLV